MSERCTKCKTKLQKYSSDTFNCGECDDPFCKRCFAKYCKPLTESSDESDEDNDQSEENDHFCRKCRKVLKDYA
jgi:hypothetical protein